MNRVGIGPTLDFAERHCFFFGSAVNYDRAILNSEPKPAALKVWFSVFMKFDFLIKKTCDLKYIKIIGFTIWTQITQTFLNLVSKNNIQPIGCKVNLLLTPS